MISNRFFLHFTYILYFLPEDRRAWINWFLTAIRRRSPQCQMCLMFLAYSGTVLKVILNWDWILKEIFNSSKELAIENRLIWRCRINHQIVWIFATDSNRLFRKDRPLHSLLDYCDLYLDFRLRFISRLRTYLCEWWFYRCVLNLERIRRRWIYVTATSFAATLAK